MEGKFTVTYRGQIVGTVQIKREGLYCRLFCRCRMPDEGIHRLFAGDEKLGVLIPDMGELVLETKVAAKRLKPEWGFTLDRQTEIFIPICPGEAFAHLEKLRSGRLGYREGKQGMLLNA